VVAPTALGITPFTYFVFREEVFVALGVSLDLMMQLYQGLKQKVPHSYSRADEGAHSLTEFGMTRR
jgi:hypothetical protein